MGYKITRRLSKINLQKYCIQNELYTRGTNADYDAMLEAAKVAQSDEDVVLLAEDIWAHSDTEKLQEMGFSVKTLIWGLLFQMLIIVEEE